jgi:TonB-linked SusC/RagA family outer membrane protein
MLINEKNIKLLGVLFLLSIGSSHFLMAGNLQLQRKITGQVTDVNGENLIGAYVTEIGDAKNGTITDIDGNYSINIKGSGTLRFSYLGYMPQEIKITNQTILNVSLVADNKLIDEVVVIGYGEVNKKDLTGSVGLIKMDELRKAPVPALDQALAGRIAGMAVNANDGQPGSEMNIVIRGGNSLTQSNTPLYVIDGFPVEDFSLSSLNPGDIQSINILKDASATAIYGSRGANGVVVIETKSAKGGKTDITYEASVGFQQVAKKLDLMGPYEFVRYQTEFYPSKFIKYYLEDRGMTLEDYKNVEGYDWQDLLFQTGYTQSHNIMLSGGNAQTRFYLSGSYYDYKGVIINSGYNRVQGRLKLDHNINKRLRTGVNLTYTNDLNEGQLASAEQRGSKSYSSYTMYQTWGFRPLFFDDAGFDPENDVIDEGANDERVNPIVAVKNEIRQKKRNMLNINGYVKYSITKELEFLARAGMIRDDSKNEAFYNSKTARGYPSNTNTRGVYGSVYNN